jgi:pyruvate formate lyase activating enzyme
VEGTVFNIQRHAVHDGPGIRTLIFLKGCPLSCTWCSNPESQAYGPEVLFDQEECVGCGDCVAVCPTGALEQTEDGRIVYRRELCVGCGKCAGECLYDARSLAGRLYTTEELLEEIRKDEAFYLTSGGGVTFSGGEPLAQPGFLGETLLACRETGIHTAIETTGSAAPERLEKIIPLVDLFLYDIKQLDSEKHRDMTSVSNGLILENLRRVVDSGASVWIRIPVVPGFNDSVEAITPILDHARQLGVSRVHLLPYHAYGSNKYRLLDRPYEMPGTRGVDMKQRVETLLTSLDCRELTVHIGG